MATKEEILKMSKGKSDKEYLIDIKKLTLQATQGGVEPEDMKMVGYVLNRWARMDSRRKQEEHKRSQYDMQFDSATQPRRDWRANPNVQFEQILIDTYTGTLPEWLPVKVTARGGRVDWVELELSKYILQEFMEREDSIDEVVRFDNLKARYWTGVLFSWLWFENQYVNNEDSGYMEEDTKQDRKEIRHIGVKSRDIRRCWFDESVKRRSEAMDCLGEETIRMEEFKMRYMEDNETPKKWYKYIQNVHTDNSKQYDSTSDNKLFYDEVRLRHYFNKLDWTYVILANKLRPIFIGKMTTKHGYLPLIPVQHYCNPESIYGIGIPERFATIKPYINNLLKATLDGIWLNSWNLIFMGGDISTDDEIYIEPGETNIIKMTGDATKIQPYSSNINVDQVVRILEVMEDFGVQTTGLNPKAQYDAGTDKAFIMWVMKEEQNMRAKSVIRNRNIWLDKAFTLMLCNILQFAPTLYAKHIFNEKQLTDFKRYEIRIPGKTLTREWSDEEWKVIGVQDTPGYDDYFNLKTDILLHANGLNVEIDTPSTPNTLKTIERDDMQKYVTSKVQIRQAKQAAMAVGDEKWAGELDEVSKKLDELYDVDADHIIMKSDEEAKRAQVADIMSAVQSIGTTPPTEWMPPIGQWLAQWWPEALLSNQQNANPMTSTQAKQAGMPWASWGFQTPVWGSTPTPLWTA